MSGLLTRGSFRKQLIVTLTVGIVVLTLSGSVFTTWLITDRLESLVISQTVQLTGQFADSSILIFLVQDKSLAQRQLGMMRSFPGVSYIAILDPKYAPFLSDGEPPQWAIQNDNTDWQQGPALAGEDDENWHFVAPVKSRPSISPYDSTPSTPETLGYVHVALSKSSTKALSHTLGFANAVMSLGIIIFLIVWLAIRVNRLTHPLTNLAGVMTLAQSDTDTRARASIEGPAEIREIGRVFNSMMEKIERHKDALESEVAIRTLALKEARDAALSAARHKAEFMAAITHEMRTPLHSINGYAELAVESLNASEMNKETTEWLKIVIDSANQLLARINQILELARIEANKIELRFDKIDLSELIGDVEAKIQPLVKTNNNSLDIKFASEKHIRADCDKLVQILINLLTNACKFTEHGSIELVVECSTRELCIRVSDTGIGIPADQQELIFEPFRQIDMSDTRKYPGTGLGLAITKHICGVLGGTLDVNSEVGVGSTFTVRLPLPMAPNQGSEVTDVDSAEAHQATSKSESTRVNGLESTL